jgi:hypothetical protein
MPLKSKAQVRKWGALVNEGKISEATFKEALSATPSVKGLPDRVKAKKKRKK